MGLEWTANNADDFVKEWKAVWSAVACLPNFDSDLKGRVFADIMNEPDSMGIKWEAGANNRGNSAGGLVCVAWQQWCKETARVQGCWACNHVTSSSLSVALRHSSASSHHWLHVSDRPAFGVATCLVSLVHPRSEPPTPRLTQLSPPVPILTPGIKVLYLKTMDALWSLTPNAVIFFVEGAGQGGIHNTNWGNGFATDRNAVRQYGLSGG